MIETSVGVISCNRCGYPILTYNIDYLRSLKGDDTIEAKHFRYVEGFGPMAHDKIRCSKCGQDFLHSIRKEWSKLTKAKDWDEENNER